MHDIVTGAKSVQQAREYYAKEFADFRRKKPTPYMERLHFAAGDQSAADPDVRVLSDDELKAAAKDARHTVSAQDRMRSRSEATPSPSRRAADKGRSRQCASNRRQAAQPVPPPMAKACNGRRRQVVGMPNWVLILEAAQ